jgi:aspartyl-tRNA(Asn)/glutamyl-tRNA(Gln) amidotransferase subunit C
MKIEHLANLARINLSEKEKKKFASQLQTILDYVAKLNQIKDKKTSPLFSINGISNVAREDNITPSFPRAQLLQNAPAKEKGFLKVRKILD